MAAILVAATSWTIAGRSPGGRPVPRRREMMLIYGGQAAATERSPPGLPIVGPTDWTIAGRSPGGRPLRRSRETLLASVLRGCEGPQPSKC